MSYRFFRSVVLAAAVLFATGCSSDVKKTYHENGNLSAVLRYKDGLLHGLCEWYFANGNPMMRAEYAHNKLNGKQERFFENGVLQNIAWYRDGRLDSVMLHYNLGGKLIMKEYYTNDTLNGPYHRYFDDGTLFIEGAYNRGMMDGSWIFYSPEGKIMGKGEFSLGSGTQKAWYPNGNSQRIIQYKDNLKHGIEEHYQPDGKLVLRRYYKFGELVSEEHFN